MHKQERLRAKASKAAKKVRTAQLDAGRLETHRKLENARRRERRRKLARKATIEEIRQLLKDLE